MKPPRDVLSTLYAVGYDAATSVLTIEFRSGRIYEYYDVPATVYRGLLGAASVGRYHDRWIKKRHYGYRGFADA